MTSTISSQYVILPPDYPDFMYHSYAKPFRDLIEWAYDEYQARLDYCAKHGYYRQHRVLTSEYSPKRLLAEMSGFRRFCSLMSERAWNDMTRAERRFISDSFEMRDLLMKDSV